MASSLRMGHRTTDLTGGGTTASPDFSWTADGSATYYYIWRNSVNDQSTADIAATLLGTENAWTEPNPVTGTWYYWITGVGSGGAETSPVAFVTRVYP